MKIPYFADVVAMTDDTEVVLLSQPPPVGAEDDGAEEAAGFWRVTSSEERTRLAQKRWHYSCCSKTLPLSLACVFSSSVSAHPHSDLFPPLSFPLLNPLTFARTRTRTLSLSSSLLFLLPSLSHKHIQTRSRYADTVPALIMGIEISVLEKTTVPPV